MYNVQLERTMATSLSTAPRPPVAPTAVAASAAPPVDQWVFRTLTLGLIGTFALVNLTLIGLTIFLAWQHDDNFNQVLPMIGALGTSVLGILAALLAPSPLQGNRG